MKNSSVLNSPRLLELKRKKNKILRKKILIYLCIFVAIIIGLSFLSKWQKLNIIDIQISGNKVIETNLIEEIAKEKIAGDYLYFFPKTNFLLYPRAQIEESLALKFKRLTDISVKVINPQKLEISVSERIPLYTYCGLTPPDTSDEKAVHEQKCYFLDKEGYIFDEAPYFSGEVYLKLYGAVSGDGENPSGSYFLQTNFSKLITLKDNLDKIKIKPSAFFIEDNGDMTILLSPGASGKGPKILFKADADFEKIVENLQTVLTTEPLQSDFKSKYSSLEKIDLRFGNKVIYKFR
jgi:hypothetical protein